MLDHIQCKQEPRRGWIKAITFNTNQMKIRKDILLIFLELIHTL